MKGEYKIQDSDKVISSTQTPYENMWPDRPYVLRIRDLPHEARPRERMVSHGPETLSLVELMSIVLNTGTTKEGVSEMSARIIKEYGEHVITSEKSPAKLSKNMNIPIFKACQIVALGEIGRRVFEKKDSGFITIRNASDVYDYLRSMHQLPKEVYI
jgi:DNA repair protein RadC